MAPFACKTIMLFFTSSPKTLTLRFNSVLGYGDQIWLHWLTLLKNPGFNHMQIWFSSVSLRKTSVPGTGLLWGPLPFFSVLRNQRGKFRRLWNHQHILLFLFDTIPWFSSASGGHCYMSPNNKAAAKPDDQCFKVILIKTPLCPSCVTDPAHHHLPKFPHTQV